jgi:hypothetical protein
MVGRKDHDPPVSSAHQSDQYVFPDESDEDVNPHSLAQRTADSEADDNTRNLHRVDDRLRMKGQSIVDHSLPSQELVPDHKASLRFHDHSRGERRPSHRDPDPAYCLSLLVTLPSFPCSPPPESSPSWSILWRPLCSLKTRSTR